MCMLATKKMASIQKNCALKRSNQFIISVFLIVLTILSACGPIREAVAPDPSRHTLQETLTGIKQNETTFRFLNTRFSGSATIEGVDYSISGTLRIKSDSAIFVSVAPLLGIEIARLLITPDTVKMVNRIDNTFYAGNMELLNSMFGTFMDFKMLQALLVGNDFSHFSSEGFRVSQNNGDIILFDGSRYPANNLGDHRFQHRLVVNGENYRITENLLHETKPQRSLQVKYNGFSRVDGQFIPQEISMIFSDSGGQAGLNLRFSRTVLNEERSFAFTVPNHYRQIRF